MVLRVTDALWGSSRRSSAARLVFILRAISAFEMFPELIAWAICLNNPYSGSITPTILDDGYTAVLNFDQPLPDADCCTIHLAGSVVDEFVVATLAGDVNRTMTVNTADGSVIKNFYGELVTDLNYLYDVNLTGTINTADRSSIKSFYGNAVESCP